MVESFGLPFAYYSFPESEAPDLPYVVYYYPNSDDMIADNKNYQPINAVDIEVYTRNKDFALESRVESILKAHDIPYEKNSTYSNLEHMWGILYAAEVIIKEN